MTSASLRAPGLPTGAARRALGLLAWATAAIGTGAAAAVGAYVIDPLVVPGLLLAAALALVTIRRPEIGIGAWFVMVPAGTTGALGSPGWLVPSAWAGFLLLVALMRADRAAARGLPPLAAPLLALVALTLVQTSQTASTAAAVPVVRVLVVGSIVFLAIALLVRRHDQVMWILGGVATGACVVAAIAVRDWAAGAGSVGFFTASGELVTRAAGSFDQPNALAGFLLIALPSCIGAALLARRGRAVFWAVAGLTVLAIVITFSRGALLGLAVVPFVFLGLRRSLLLAPLLVVATLGLAPDVLRERFATASLQGAEAATRLDFWRTATTIWSENPVLGVGPGGFADAYVGARIPGKQFLPSSQFEPPPHAHNLVLNVLAEQGLIGLAAFTALFAGALVALARTRRNAERWIRLAAATVGATLLALLAHGLLDVTLVEVTGQMVFALIGLASALSSIAAAGSEA